ncbi:uncharacterized protein LOC124665584 isoform X1 [Lolium rigidum]|uniref:uncharacterized protein LOC124665584 isoform X1 n=1 Tax=Lolium rigidum TaxID=89674 RepID=UPI001F5D0B0B|nr:uncharacterized protein LOC124665584 isoform X1 [Lolium rigidum]
MGANHVRCRTEAMPQWVCMTLIQCLRTIEHDQEEIQNVLSRCYWYIGIYMVCCHQLMFKVAQAVLSLSASYRSGVAYKYFWRLLCVKGKEVATRGSSHLGLMQLFFQDQTLHLLFWFVWKRLLVEPFQPSDL